MLDDVLLWSVSGEPEVGGRLSVVALVAGSDSKSVSISARADGRSSSGAAALDGATTRSAWVRPGGPGLICNNVVTAALNTNSLMPHRPTWARSAYRARMVTTITFIGRR